MLENIINNVLSKGKSQGPYNDEIKKFAITLQYYSPRAYLYVRKSFGKILPHPRTLRRWYMVVDGKPGFTKESFNTIAIKVKSEPVYCNIVIDEMCVRRQVEMDTQNNIYGHINMGANETYDGDDIPLAKNALVFLAVGINGYWKIPLGYFLIDSLTGLERSNLLLTCLELLHETGANVKSVTFDGAYVNGTMCTSLGANLTLENTRPFIEMKDSKNKVK